MGFGVSRTPTPIRSVDECREGGLEAEFALDDGDRHAGRDGARDLRLHCILTGGEEALDAQVLFDQRHRCAQADPPIGWLAAASYRPCRRITAMAGPAAAPGALVGGLWQERSNRLA